MNVRAAALAVFTALVLAAAAAWAAEWWSPAAKQCPTFPTKEACVAWCEQNRRACNFVAHCQVHTGDQKPSCDESK